MLLCLLVELVYKCAIFRYRILRLHVQLLHMTSPPDETRPTRVRMYNIKVRHSRIYVRRGLLFGGPVIGRTFGNAGIIYTNFFDNCDDTTMHYMISMYYCTVW